MQSNLTAWNVFHFQNSWYLFGSILTCHMSHQSEQSFLLVPKQKSEHHTLRQSGTSSKGSPRAPLGTCLIDSCAFFPCFPAMQSLKWHKHIANYKKNVGCKAFCTSAKKKYLFQTTSVSKQCPVWSPDTVPLNGYQVWMVSWP